MRMIVVVLASSGLALPLVSGLSFLACSSGFLFTGLSILFVVPGAVAVCAIVTPITARVLRRKQRYFGWRTLFLEVAVLAFVAVGILSWLDTRQQLRIFMDPSSVPGGLRVDHGRSILFGSFVHFTGSPAAIASLLKSKALVEVPTKRPETSDSGDWAERERTKDSWSWWQPMTMSDPKLFIRNHTSETGQGWSEGWWVNGATNEVYAFISG